MKVLYLDPADFLGGAELFTLDLLSTLSKTHTITLVTSGADERYLERIPEDVAVVRYLIPRLRPFRPIAYIMAVITIRRLCKKENIDLIHSNSVRAGLVAAACGKPWVHFAHDFTLPKAFTSVFRQARMICACSQAVKNNLVAKGVTSKKIRIIPNGVDIDAYTNLSKQVFDPKKPVIAIVGRLDSWKGQDVFIEAAKSIHAQISDARFMIYGESSAHDAATVEFEKKLKSLAPEYIEFIGFCPMEEILQNTDIFIHASTQAEPFGRVVLEAMAADIPIVAAWNGGVPEILGDELQGFGCTPGNVSELSTKVIDIIQNPELPILFSSAAKKRVQQFDLAKIVEQISENWQKI